MKQKKILIMRHAEAYSAEESPERSLNPLGVMHAKKMAAWAYQIHIPIKIILHSKALRSKETAFIMGEKYGIQPIHHPALNPDEPLLVLSQIIGDLDSNTLLVGHLPNIDRLSNLLITYDAACPTLSFLPAAMAAFSLNENSCFIDWAISPDLINEKAILF